MAINTDLPPPYQAHQFDQARSITNQSTNPHTHHPTRSRAHQASRTSRSINAIQPDCNSNSLQLPNERTGLISTSQSQIDSSHPQLSTRLLLLLYSTSFSCALFALSIALAITNIHFLPQSSTTCFSHRAALDLPLAYALLASLLPLLPIVLPRSRTPPSIRKLGPFRLIAHSVSCQLALISLDFNLRRTQSSLAILAASLLLASSFISAQAARYLHSFHPLSLPRSLVSRSPSPPSLLASWLSNCISKLYLALIACSLFLLSSKVLFMVSDPSPLSKFGLLPINPPLSDSLSRPASPWEARVQLTCLWLNEPSPTATQSNPTIRDTDLPLSTKTIISFSPSRHTSSQASQWIQAMKLEINKVAGVRLCQFDRPGYNHSDNLPTSRISDAVSALEQALQVAGEIGLVKRYWSGLGVSGFVLVGHGYGALEATLFATRHPSLTKSVLYINPHTGSSFFSTDSGLSSLGRLVTGPFKNTYHILSASSTYTIRRYLSAFSPIRNLFLGCHSLSHRQTQWSSLHSSLCAPVEPDAWTPSMARAVLQESSVAHSAAARQEMSEAERSMPKSVTSVVLASSRDSRGVAKPSVISSNIRPGNDYYYQPDDARLCVQTHTDTCQSTLHKLLFAL